MDKSHIIKELGVENVYPLELITWTKRKPGEAISYGRIRSISDYDASYIFLKDDGDKDEKDFW